MNAINDSQEERECLTGTGSTEVSVLKQAKKDIHKCCCRDYFPCIPARYVLSVMGCIGFLIVYALRVNMSVALVAMVNETASSSGPHTRAGSNGSTVFSSCQPTAPVFNWGPEDQGGQAQLRAHHFKTQFTMSCISVFLCPPSLLLSQVGYCPLSFMVFFSLKFLAVSWPLGSVASMSLVWVWSSRQPSPC